MKQFIALDHPMCGLMQPCPDYCPAGAAGIVMAQSYDCKINPSFVRNRVVL
jgi:hypothetical protein